MSMLRYFFEIGTDPELFCQVFENGDAEFIERYLNALLSRSISVRDVQAREGKKENFYHGILLGMLNSRMDDWEVEFNVESRDGYLD